MVNVIIGSARISENGRITGGRVGDQKQKAVPDYSGEVSEQKFYVHKKGWVVLRARNADVAKNIGDFIHCKDIIDEAVVSDEDAGKTSFNVDFTIILGRDFDGRYVK